MKICFNVNYYLAAGQKICITGSNPELGSGDKLKALPLISDANGQNHIEIEFAQGTSDASYSYIITEGERIARQEWGDPHYIRLAPTLSDATIFDSWQDQPSDKPFYSKAFTQCICRPEGIKATKPLSNSTLQITVSAPMIPPGIVLAICGDAPSLGQWDPVNAHPMTNDQFPNWTVQLPIHEFAGKSTEYKFIALREKDHAVIAWDSCNNRTIHIARQLADNQASVVVNGLHFSNPMPLWKGAGVAIPVFSLRTDKDFGVGDFFDLIPMIDWAAATGQKVIQLLPINDTTMTHTWTDSYPYNANSCFALHPMYLRLSEMGQLSNRKKQSQFDALANELNQLAEIDYERVNQAKDSFTQQLFAQQGSAEMTSPAFKKFLNTNINWLKPYAAFCTLRDLYHTADMTQWEQYATYDAKKIDKFIEQHQQAVNYVYYLQYHLDRQLRKVVDYAHSKGVAIKGDIPIGISRNSVDAWTDPDLFNLNVSAGAPPDDFSVLGQNWGFPTYNWDVMARDGYAWWKARFRKMAEYFDAYRIDHVLGFFRIWQIPLNAIHGLLGIFNPALPLSPDEMRHSFDFHFNATFHTSPYIADWMLGEIFGDLTDQARAQFLTPTGDGNYKLKPEFTTQRQVAAYFGSEHPTDPTSQRLCEGLLKLLDQVLFIEDPVEKGKYHPRIAGNQTYTYRAMNDYQRSCFDRLYTDFFYYRHNDFWHHKAMQKLPPLTDATKMLVCAEDLGMIPACVPDVMHRLEILSLEIQRMPKDPNQEFADTWHYPYLSVCTTSTHDMSGIRGWWEENPQLSQRYYNNVLHHEGGAPYFAEPWICEQIIDLHLKSPSMLCILPLQDWLSTNEHLRRQDPHQEQINVPANPRHYWRYRMHLTIEQLLQSTEFNNKLRSSILQSNR